MGTRGLWLHGDIFAAFVGPAAIDGSLRVGGFSDVHRPGAGGEIGTRRYDDPVRFRDPVGNHDRVICGKLHDGRLLNDLEIADSYR